MTPAFIRTQAFGPRHLIETQHLLELAPCIYKCHLFQCSLFILILLLRLYVLGSLISKKLSLSVQCWGSYDVTSVWLVL